MTIEKEKMLSGELYDTNYDTALTAESRNMPEIPAKSLTKGNPCKFIRKI